MAVLTTGWPDSPGDQTVSEITGGVTISASRDGFGLHPYGRPSNAFDGDPSTAWITGGFHTANLKALLDAKGVSYISVMPQVWQETNLKKYENVLLGQHHALGLTAGAGGVKERRHGLERAAQLRLDHAIDGFQHLAPPQHFVKAALENEGGEFGRQVDHVRDAEERDRHVEHAAAGGQRAGLSKTSMGSFPGSPSAGATWATSCPGASSRCSPSGGP